MEPSTLPTSLGGGILIGLAAVLLLAMTGRIAGNSGIIAQGLPGRGWALCYIFGLLAGAGAWRLLFPQDPGPTYNPSPALLVVAGLLVGFGTRVGNGCTSGHGVCGIGRLSVRSVVATCVFMAVSMITVWVVRQAGGVWW